MSLWTPNKQIYMLQQKGLEGKITLEQNPRMSNLSSETTSNDAVLYKKGMRKRRKEVSQGGLDKGIVKLEHWGALDQAALVSLLGLHLRLHEII